MAAGQLDLWGGLALLALLAIVVALLWGVFRSTGKRPIRPSGREHHHDDWGSNRIGRNSSNPPSTTETSSDSGGSD